MKIRKLFLKIMTFSAMIVLSLGMMFACSKVGNDSGSSSGSGSGNGSGNGGNTNVPTIILSETDKTLDLNESFTLTATLQNVSGTVVWTSSDPAVASVDQNGRVQGKIEGNATITATVEQASASCAVIVEKSHNLPVLNLSADTVEIVEPNKEITVTASINYNGNPVDGLTYEWTTDVDGIVELTPSADTSSVVVKGVKFGTVTVSCVTVCNGVPLYPSFTVTVFNPNVTFEVAGSTESAEGYPVNLTLFDDAENDNAYTLSAITVKDGTQVIDNSQIQWFVEDEDVATFENGVIQAKAIGETRVLALYNNNGIYFDVTVSLANFTVTDFTYIEVAEDNGFVRSEKIKGTVEAVVYNKADLFKEESGGRIHLDEKAVETIGLGEVIDPIVVHTDQATYSYENVEFIAMLIDNKADFDRMDEVALSLGDGDTATPTMDGIFYLNADIAYNGVYTPNEKNVANDSLGGFVGTFDGRGHVISGLKIENKGYIFASIKSKGVFKNVTFLNAEFDGSGMVYGTDGTGAFLAKIVDGELTNVFIHLAKVTLKDCNAMLIAQANHGGAKAYQNVIVAIDQVVKAAGSKRTPVLQTFGSRSWSAPFNNAIGIAPTTSGVDLSMLSTCENDGKGNAVNWQTYPNQYTALTAMDEAFASQDWDTDFWHSVNGIVLPKTVTIGTTTQTYEVGNNTTGIQNWVNYKRNVEGVSSYTYKSGYTYNPNLTVDLSSYNFSSLLSATIGGVEYASGYSSGTLTIDKSTLVARGDTTLLLVGKVNNKTVSVIQPLLLADLFISTADDFEAMQWLADAFVADVKTENGITVMKAGGYIVLTNNINYNRTYKVHERSHSWGDGTNKGFTGTLDGRGFVVNGLEMVEQTYAQNTYSAMDFCKGAFSSGKTWTAGSGIFASLYAGGTIKNIGFTNAKHSCGGGFITTLAYGGSNVIENVYVHLTYARGIDSQPTDRYTAAGVFQARMHGGSFMIRNSVVVIDRVEAGKYYYDFGAFTQHPDNYVAPTRSNVYIISSNEELVASITDGAPTFATTLSGVTKYADATAATAGKSAWSAGLTSSVWNTTGNLPVFAKA